MATPKRQRYDGPPEYIRREDASYYFQIGDDTIDELADECGAKRKVRSMVLIIRPDGSGGYEMISGHRRMHAAKLAGLKKIPSVIKEMSDDDAVIAMVDSNVQREEILPSERAFSFKMKMEALKRQGSRSDLSTSGLEVPKLKEIDEGNILR